MSSAAVIDAPAGWALAIGPVKAMPVPDTLAPATWACVNGAWSVSLPARHAVSTAATTPVSSSPPLPMTSGYVVDWQMDGERLYTGCWVAVGVTFPLYYGVSTELAVNVEHHFKFEGIALKRVGNRRG